MTYDEAVEKAQKIVRAFVRVSTAHGYPPAQTCMLETWITDALCEFAAECPDLENRLGRAEYLEDR